MSGCVYQYRDAWWFWGLNSAIGPYRTAERAEEKYWEYRAYVVDAPACHHA